MQAFASDILDTVDVKCIIRDVSKHGCMIVSSHVHDLPDLIQIVPESFNKPLNGKIVWRKDKTAGILFLEDDEEVAEIAREFCGDMIANLEEDEPLNLAALIRPLSYSDRLTRYNSQQR